MVTTNHVCTQEKMGALESIRTNDFVVSGKRTPGIWFVSIVASMVGPHWSHFLNWKTQAIVATEQHDITSEDILAMDNATQAGNDDADAPHIHNVRAVLFGEEHHAMFCHAVVVSTCEIFMKS